MTGHLIGLGLAASLALLMRRRRLVLLMAGVALTVGLHGALGLVRCCRAPPAASESPMTRIATPGSAAELSVLTLNGWPQQGDTERIERYLATAPADVVVLSQVTADKRPILANLKAAYPFRVDCDHALPCSLVLLSRLPFEGAGAGRIGPDQPIFLWARFGGSLTVIGTQLTTPSRSPWRHERQMSALAQFVRHIDGPLILTGDLNSSPWSSAFRRLRAGTSLVPASILMPSWPAWPLAFPQVALDHIFVSRELTVTATGTGPAVGSDHLPVWAQLEWRPSGLDRRSPVRKLASGLAAARPHLGGQLLADLGREHGRAGNLSR